MDMGEWKLKTWKINPSKLQNWKRLDPTFPKEKATDCVINSLAFLGILEVLYSDKDVELFAEFQNRKDGIINEKDILRTIYDKLHLVKREKYELACVKDLVFMDTKDKYTLVRNTASLCFRPCVYMFGFLNNLHSQINNGEFTILNLHREVGGHSVVMGKMNDNLYIIDPQQETVYKEKEKMDIDNNNNNCIDVRSISSLFEDYLIKEKAIGLSFIVIKETSKRITEGPINIRRPKTPEPPLKKLKLSGGKKKNGKKKKTYKKNGKKKLKHTRKYKKKKTIKKHKKKSGKKKH